MRPLLFVLLIVTAPPALADGVYKDRERFAERPVVVKRTAVIRAPVRFCPGLPRRTDRSPDYAGSPMGLGRPSYYGFRHPVYGPFPAY